MRIDRSSLKGQALLIIDYSSYDYIEDVTDLENPSTIIEQIPQGSSVKEINQFVCDALEISGDELLKSGILITIYEP